MSEPKVTRENEHLEWLNDRLKEEYDRHSRHYYAIKNALIEHGPEVSREFVEGLLTTYCLQIPDTNGEFTLSAVSVSQMIDMLTEAGVTVKEKK